MLLQVDEENVAAEGLQENVEDDTRAEWVKFLIDKLDFRLEKVSYMQENHGVDSCEAFFDAYAPD